MKAIMSDVAPIVADECARDPLFADYPGMNASDTGSLGLGLGGRSAGGARALATNEYVGFVTNLQIEQKEQRQTVRFQLLSNGQEEEAIFYAYLDDDIVFGAALVAILTACVKNNWIVETGLNSARSTNLYPYVLVGSVKVRPLTAYSIDELVAVVFTGP